MAWSASSVFTQFVINPLFVTVTNGAKPTGFTSLTADTVKAALFNNSATPNKDDTLANSAYGAGQWVSGNEVTGTGWSAGGQTLSGNAFSNGTGYEQFTASTVAATGVTISNAYGTLVYDSSVSGGTVANQGICFNYFGGAQSVTAGNFSIIWNANGIFRVTTT